MQAVVDAEAARVLPVEAAAFAEDRLDAGVVSARVVAEADGAEVVVPGVAPAREGARLLADVALGVAVAVGADREELHHLAPVVLVRRVLGVVRAREPEQHRRVLRDFHQERRERAERVGPEEVVLPEHQPRRPDPVSRGGEPVVPDEGHPLDQRPVRPNHPVEPPELIVAPGVVRGERVSVVVVRPRAPEPLVARVRQLVDRALETELRELLGFTLPRAEAGTPKEPLGLRLAKAPSVHGDGHAQPLSAGRGKP